MKDIPELVKGAMESIKDMLGSEQVIGKPITTPNGDVVIPVTQLTFGFGAGGVRIKPVAFLVISDARIKLLPITDQSSAIDKILDIVPDILDRFNSEEKKEQ